MKCLERWNIPLPKTKWVPKTHTDDFGQELNEIVLAKEIDERKLSPIKSSIANKAIWEGVTFVNTPRNLKVLAPALGIVIKDTETFFYVRDSFIRLWDGSVKVAVGSNQIEPAIERTHSSRLYLDKTATTRTYNQLFNHWSGYSHRSSHCRNQEWKALFSENCSPFKYTYVEGGNLYTLTNNQGKIVALVGEDHLYHTLQILQLEGRNWTILAREAKMDRSFDEMVEERIAKLSEEEVSSYCEEMYSQGLLLCGGKSGLIAPSLQLTILLSKFFSLSNERNCVSEKNRGWFRALALQSKAIDLFKIDDQKTKVARIAAAKYLVQLEIVKALMALDFNIPPENLHFITQMNYHLDIFILPAPHHSLFIVNFALCADVIKSYLDRKIELNLSENDLLLLEGYLETALKLDLELGSLLLEVTEQLRAAGFTVIPMPGHFMYEPQGMYQQFPMPSEGICINFTNGISGWSSKTQSYYYITHGIHAGDQVGHLLMSAFRAFLEHYIPDISVYFVGYDPENPQDFSEAMDFWNRLETQSGIHCVTFFKNNIKILS